MTSQVLGTHVRTDRQIIALGHDAVATYRVRDGGGTARAGALRDPGAKHHDPSRRFVPLRGAHFLDSKSRVIAERFGAGEEQRTRVSEMIDTSSWLSLEKVMLPSRDFPLSWQEQALPAPSAAIEDAVEQFEGFGAERPMTLATTPCWP